MLEIILSKLYRRIEMTSNILVESLRFVLFLVKLAHFVSPELSDSLTAAAAALCLS